jgi:hypothetical protein
LEEEEKTEYEDDKHTIPDGETFETKMDQTLPREKTPLKAARIDTTNMTEKQRKQAVR